MEASVSSDTTITPEKADIKIYKPLRDKDGNWVKELVTDPEEYAEYADSFRRARERSIANKSL